MEASTPTNDFELLLKNKRETLAIYRKQHVNNEQGNKPEDVINIVKNQMMAIQKADATKTSYKSMNPSLKSKFLTVSELPNYHQEPQEMYMNKFETQSVSDTQLIELLRNIENEKCEVPNDRLINKKNQITNDSENLKTSEITTNKCKENDAIDDLEKSISELFDDEMDNDFNDNIFRSQIFEMDRIDVISDEDRPSSPVLNIKAKQSPLVFDLEKFERFETIAFPLVTENEDLNRVKYLINSQICSGELNIGVGHHHLYNTEKRSPILNIEHKIVLTTATLDLVVAEDEILFSSDEENERMIQDLPLTCAFNVSEDKKEVLDKSIYVGFQTASNIPIQVAHESFTKAKSILNFENTDNISIKDMVDACDAELKDKYDKNTIEDNNDLNTNKSDNLTTKAAKRKYDGFTTASNKIIKLSNSALKRSKKVFQDIDLNETFDDKNENSNDNLQEMNDIFDDNNKIDEDNYIFDDNAHEHLVNDDFSNKFNMDTDEEIDGFRGFKTASNKAIEISKESLLKTKSIFKDIDDLTDKESTEFDYLKKTSNKNVVVPKEPILKTRSLIEDLNFELNDANIIKEFENVDMTIRNEPMNEEFDRSDNLRKDMTSKHLEKDTNNETNVNIDLVGCRTANYKNIEITKEALLKSNDLFKDVINDSDFVHKTDTQENKLKTINELTVKYTKINDNVKVESSLGTFVGFKTANNKNIKISNEALIKSKNLFQDIDNFHIKELESTEFDGFKTASNKNVEVSKEPMLKTRNIFKDIDDLAEENIETNGSAGFKGFKTASNKAVEISKESLLKTKSIFNDIDDLAEENIETNGSAGFKGFKTASNKAVEISKESLLKTKSIFKDIDDFTEKETSVFDGFKGFKTTSNKNVEISKESMLKTRNIFKDIDDFTEKNIETNVSGGFKGFKTASNKAVEISKESLLKTRNIFKDIDDFTEKETTDFDGFKTAGNKNVLVSKESMLKTRNVLKDTDDFTERERKETTRSDGFSGFKTASNKAVEISKESMLKTRNIFKDIDDYVVQQNEETTEFNYFKGFKTASNKNVVVSNESLLKTKSIFKDIDDSTEKNKETNDSNGFRGFKTANNKNIEVSKDSLNKTKYIFKDVNKENDNNLDSNITHNKLSTIKLPGRAMSRTKKIFENIFDKKEKTTTNNDSKRETFNDRKKAISNNDENAKRNADIESKDDFLDDRLKEELNDTLYTEDFRTIRSTSPILSCPKAKRRKIEKEIENVVVKFKNDYKKTKAYTLKDLIDLERNFGSKQVDIQIDSLLDFVFDNERNDLTKTTIDLKDLEKIFLGSINPKLVPKGWIENHLKLILWKLLSYEMKFPNIMGNICSVRNVIDQLKYRYDRELYNAERPALRKILEKDDVPSKTLVLCVASIYCDGVEVKSLPTSPNVELLVTDGWYSVMASIDGFLSRMVQNGKMAVGNKIMTSGAELLNCEGVSPWEDISSVRLKLSGNSTRRCSWHMRLGHHSLRPFSRLRHIDVQGGRVARLKLHVARVYPPLYVEKLADGSTVTRSDRLELLHQTKYETDKQTFLEKIQEEIEKEYYEQESQELDSQDISRREENGTQLYRMMKKSRDPNEYRTTLTTTQNKILQDYLNLHQDKIVHRLQTKLRERMESGFVRRNVVGVVRIRVLGMEKNTDNFTRGTLSIWKPNEDVLDIVKEGVSIEVTNVMPTAVRYSEIQLSAGRQSMFKIITKDTEKIQEIKNKIKRKAYTLKDLIKNPSMTTEYNEIDTAGLVVHIDPKKSFFDTKMQFQNVYLSDINKNIVSINFWGGVAKFGYENFLDTGQVVACFNLQKRAGNTRKSIPQYRATEFSYFTKSPKMVEIRNVMLEMEESFRACNIKRFCEECVILIENTKKRCYNEIVTPYRSSDLDLSKKVFIETPLSVTSNDLKVEADSNSMSPKTLLRRKQIKEKIAKLKTYGEPPPLSTITILNRSTNAMAPYKSPVSVDRSINLPNGRNLVSLKANKVINPTKLNFEVDDLDSSLPLSLDS